VSIRAAIDRLEKIGFESREEWDGSYSVRIGKRGCIVKDVPKFIADKIAIDLNHVITSNRISLRDRMSIASNQTAINFDNLAN
jgi:hypothetical protein